MSAFTCSVVMPGLVQDPKGRAGGVELYAFGTTTKPHPEEVRSTVSKDEASPAISGRSFETPLAAAPQDEVSDKLCWKEGLR